MAASAPALMPIGAAAATLPRSLDQLVESLADRIEGSLDGRWRPWALPTLATQAAEGPRARVLALRSFDRQHWKLTFQADARSDKVREVRAEPRVSVVFWDPADAIEARFSGRADIHQGDAIARDAWQRVSRLRHMACSIDAACGTPLREPQRFDALPATGELAMAFERFVVIVVELRALDWLWLGVDDMRRASLRRDGDAWTGQWIVP